VQVVRCKLYCPSTDNFGTRWVEASVDDFGSGTVIFPVYRPTMWTKFRVATRDNTRLLQENFLNDGDGIEVETGDVVTVDFVVHEFAFRVRLNDDLDDEDEAIIALMKLQKRIESPVGSDELTL
jgi:hypothetical protein